MHCIEAFFKKNPHKEYIVIDYFTEFDIIHEGQNTDNIPVGSFSFNQISLDI